MLTHYILFTVLHTNTLSVAEGQEEEEKENAPLDNENDPESTSPILSRGDRVRTPYGDGVVVRRRSAGEDDVEDDNTAGFVYEVRSTYMI